MTEGLRRWRRPIATGLTIAMSVVALSVFWAVLSGAMARQEVGHDAELYIGFAARWRETGQFYFPEQFAGPYVAEGSVNLYPPLALYLLVPFTVLPLVGWWLVPLGVIAWQIWTLRPAYWSAPLIAGCLMFVAPSAILVYGNTDLWTAAILCLSLRWPASSWALAFKPSVLPLAILFARGRRWWIGAVVIFVLALPFGSMWLDYFEAMSNLETTLLRSFSAAPWFAIPFIVWVARTRRGAEPDDLPWP